MMDKKSRHDVKSVVRKVMYKAGLRPPVVDLPARGLVLEDINVINPRLSRESRRKMVVVGTRIAGIGESEGDGRKERGAPRFAGAFALPGLIDMHVHYPLTPWRAPATFDFSELASLLFLMHGVTTVRDMGSFDTIWNLRERLHREEFPAPRVFLAGKILDGDPPRMGKMAWPLRTPEEAIKAVDSLAARKVDFIKVYDFLSLELLTAIREAASRHGLKVVGHLPLAVNFEDAHINEIEHLFPIQFTVLRPHLNFYDPHDFADFMEAWANIDDRRVNEIVRISVEQGVSHTPTIVVVERIGRMMNPSFRDDPVMRFLPRCFRDVLWNEEHGIKWLIGHPREVMENVVKAVRAMKELTGLLYREGVHIYAGSDTPGSPGVVPGASLQEELGHLVDAGLTPEEAWAASSREAGDALGLPMLGVLKPGAPADFLIFREDPTMDLKALSTLEAVVAYGRLYARDMLNEAFDRHRDYFESWLYDRVTMAAMRSALKDIG